MTAARSCDLGARIGLAPTSLFMSLAEIFMVLRCVLRSYGVSMWSPGVVDFRVEPGNDTDLVDASLP
jgi:hypothetical protein